MRILRPALVGVFAALIADVCLVDSANAQVSNLLSYPAGSESAAKVLQLSGQVSVLRGSDPWALNVGDFVQQRQVVLTGADGFAIFQVSDGSTFEVFPNSRVAFRNNPGEWKDLLDLWLGRVKVYIRKWGGQPNPARVFTPTAVISVRGTVFDVALEDGDTTYVAVEEGQVGVRHRLIPQDEPKLINPGEAIRVYKNAPLARARIDRGTVAQKAANALSEAFYTIMMRGPRGTTGGGAPGGPGPLPGDSEAPAPPPPPPPPLSDAPPPPPAI